MDRAQVWRNGATDTALGWLSSPAALSQIALLIMAYLAARYLVRRFAFVIGTAVTPEPKVVHVITFGKRVFLLLAASDLGRKVLPPGFLKLMGLFVLLPIVALHAVGLLEASEVNLGNFQFTALMLIRGLIAGSLLFGLGARSNRQFPVLVAAWNALKTAAIKMPYPHRVVELRNAPGG